MSDVIQLTPGLPPWRPTEDAGLDTTYEEWDVPLLGIIRQPQGSVAYLFECVLGRFEGVQLWLYAHLADIQKENLDQAEGPDFEGLVEHIFRRSLVMAAVADDEHGLIIWAEVDLSDRPRAEFATAAIAVLLERLKSMEQLQEGLASR